MSMTSLQTTLAAASDASDRAEALAALELSRRPGVGAASFREAIARHGTPSAALAAWQPPARTRCKAATAEGLDRGRAWVASGGLVRWYGCSGYPASLADLGEPPPVLFVSGDAGVLGAPAVTIVGGREADRAAVEAARALGRWCAGRGLAVVSGAALGVDGAAMEGALDAGGRVVAVLGSGVDVVYPPAHRALLARCAAQGAVVSELLPGTPPMRSFFVTRNRILAALGACTVLVWGRSGSGALVTVRWARRLGRPVGALAWPVAGASDEAWAMGAARVEWAASDWVERQIAR